MTTSVPDLFLTIREAGARFRAGDLSPVELTRATLVHIERLNLTLHHYVEVDAEGAINAARAAEHAWRQPAAPHPLCGVPFAVKDIVDVRGLPTRCGSAIRQDAAPAADDAVVVAALRRAGSVMIGKTVTQEFAAGTLSPPARNPWDSARVPGGSSGGSAVAVATGTAMTAIGSDTGGSIRNPASLCGVVGLKPTFGTVSTAGVFPLSWSLDTIGPLARTVDDAWLTFAAMRGLGTIAPLAKRDLQGVRLGIPRLHFYDRLETDTMAAIEHAIAHCRDLGATIIESPWADAIAARACAFLINRVESVSVHEPLLGAGERDLERLNRGLRLRLVAGQLIPASVYARSLRARETVKRSVARYFTEHDLDAVLTPVAPATAVPADRPVVGIGGVEEDAGLAYTRLTQPFNATGQPAIAIPCGFDGGGLPVGLQLAGKPFAERALCEIAYAYEQATEWHHHRPPLGGHVQEEG